MRKARLDFFLISDVLMSYVDDANIIPGYRTDHSGIDITLCLSAHSRGKGYWKFNNSLLRNKVAIEVINSSFMYIKELYALPVYDLDFI